MRRSFYWGLLALALCCWSCDNRNVPAHEHSEGKAVQSTAPPRDLSRDEDAGGHTLARHIGRSDDELRERLQHERISAASTYTDLSAAEGAVGGAIAQNQSRIRDWSSTSGGHPNLVLDYDSPQPIGRTLRRGATASAPCSHVLVVLKWRPPSEYFVLTSYPECR